MGRTGSALWTSRLYQNEQDLEEMQAMLMVGRAQTNDWRYPHIGDLLFGYFMVACHLDPTRHIRVWHVGEQLVGYAILGEDPAFDCQVLPDYSWDGIEDEAMNWAEELAAELSGEDAQLWGGSMEAGARQDDVRRIAFLEGHGFHPGSQFSEVNMICSLGVALPETVAPKGCQVVSMAELTETGAAETARRAAVHREVWQPWTVGNIRDEDYADFMRLPGYHRDLDVAAVAADGVIAAYVNGWVDPLNRVGDFGPVGTRPGYRRQGLGRAVLSECLRRMQGYGMDRVSVSTGVENNPAIRLYESVGFNIVNRYLGYVKD